MHAYEQQHKVRLLDYLDLHFYPQAENLSFVTLHQFAERTRIALTRLGHQRGFICSGLARDGHGLQVS